MKLSDDLQQCHVSGDFGKALEGYAERAKQLEDALNDARNGLLYVRSVLVSCTVWALTELKRKQKRL